ncbi:sensor histidine kinase [Streptomyces sp. NPDC023327]|uniref:sensor histidine kinase n=1 Tax=Streptomyces sp. NPDC023327 TaxID=3157088 RepID=UPI0033F4830A
MQIVLVTAVVAGCALFTYLSDKRQAEDAARHQATAAARAVADSPSVREAIREDDEPSKRLQPYASRVQRHTDVDFVTIMDPRGIRWTHPDERRIGERFLGHTARALRGETFAETYTGTLGPSVRVVTPIRAGEAGEGRVIGLVSAGITIEEITEKARGQLLALLGVAAAALVLGGIGTYVVNARLRRSTHGMNAAELSRMHDYHEAALHAVREGLLMLDGQRRIALINDAGRELLGVPGDTVGRNVAELGLPAPLTGALLASEPRVDELHLTADRVVVVNTSPVSGGERRGTVVTLRDHTELQALTGELDSERGFTRALRSQAHEAANRLHTVVSLIELGRAEEAVDFATAELELAQALTDQVVAAVSEPVLAALLLGKAAQANEHGVELVVSADSSIDDGMLPASLSSRDLVTVLGNLIDNAVDAAQGSPAARVTVTARADGTGLLLRVADTGPGVDPGLREAVFERGWSTKAATGRGLGLALVHQTVTRNGGTLTLRGSAEGGAEFEVTLAFGADGRSGADGVAGAAGPAGGTVSSGAAVSSGADVPAGTTGANGAAGAVVPAGAAGVAVPAGAAGVAVPAGAAGVAVPAGAAGTTRTAVPARAAGTARAAGAPGAPGSAVPPSEAELGSRGGAGR